MNKPIKPSILAVIAVVVIAVLSLVGYRLLKPGALPQSSAAKTLGMDQPQQDRFHLTPDQTANMNRLPPYVQHAAAQSSYQRNFSSLPQLVREDPNKLTPDQRAFLKSLPPYLLHRAQGTLNQQHGPKQ